MRYELLLQPLEAALPYEPERVEPLLTARGIGAAGQDGSRLWKLKNGPVDVRPLRDGPNVRGVELHIGLSDQLELIREAVVEASALAAEAGLRLYDPQLSRSLNANDAELVADQFLRTARYAGEMLGITEALGASYAVIEPQGSTGMKVIFGVIGAALLLLFLFDFIASRAL